MCILDTPVVGLTATPGAAVEHHDGGAGAVAALLPVHGVQLRHGQHPGLGGLKIRIEDIIQGFSVSGCHDPSLFKLLKQKQYNNLKISRLMQGITLW